MLQGKILIVEDEAIAALDLQIMLEQWGYERPTIATTGDEALEISEQVRPDVALTDIHIHGEMDGIETARRLSSEFGTSVIFMTGYCDEDIMEKAKAISPAEILQKPLNVEKLKEVVGSAVRKAAKPG